MKKVNLVVVCFLLLLSLSACTEDKLSEHIIINGFGVDYDNDEYKLTVRYAGLEELGQEEVMNVSGETIYEAMNNISLTTGKTPIYSSPSYLICSAQVAENGMDSVLDFFTKYFKTKPTIQLYISENSAEFVLNLKDDKDKLISSSVIELITEGNSNEQKTVNTSVMSFINDSLGESSCALVPIISVENKTIFSEKTAVFSDFNMNLILDEKETKGYLVSKGELKNEVVVVDYENNDKVTAQIVDIKSCFNKISETNFIIKIKANVNIIAAPLEVENLNYKMLENEIKNEINYMINLCSRKMNENSLDIYNLSNFLYLNHSNFWKENSDNFIEKLSELNIDTDLEITFIKELEKSSVIQ